MTPHSPQVSVSYFGLLRNRNFALLWFGQSASLLGDIIFMFSINWLILEKTGSALQVGGNLVVTVISGTLFSTLAGVLADRWDRRWLLLISDLLRGGIVLTLALVLWAIPFNITYIYIFTFLLTAIASFFMPAYQSIIPNILEKETLVVGRSLTVASSRLLQAMGSAFSGILIAIFSTQWGIVINGLSFLVSAFTIFLTHIPQSTTPPKKPLTTSTMFSDALVGLQFIRGHAVLFSLFLLFTLTDFGAAFTWPVHVVFAEKVLMGGSELYGYLATSALLGGFVGAFLIGRYSKWFNYRAGVSYFIATLAWGVLSMIFALTSSIPLALAYRFLIGGALSMIHVPISSLLDAHTPDEYRGRVWSTIGIGSSIVSTFSVGFSGLIADYTSPRYSYLIAGALLVITAFFAFSLPSIRKARIE